MRTYVGAAVVIILSSVMASCSSIESHSVEVPIDSLVVEVGLEESFVFPLCSYLEGNQTAVDPDWSPDPIGRGLCIDGAKDGELPEVGDFIVVRRVDWGPNRQCYEVRWGDVLRVYESPEELLRALNGLLDSCPPQEVNPADSENPTAPENDCPPQKMNPADSEGWTLAESEGSGGNEE